MDSTNCSGSNLIVLASSLAIIISNEFGPDNLDVLAAFFSALGDNLALISASK